MGDISISIASKGKAVIGGLLKRVTGDKPDKGEEAAPRKGVSLKNRFSVLRPSAAPTDPVPQKRSEDLPDPDGNKEVKVIQTSSARASRSASLSERIGLSASSGAEDSFERRISFEDVRGEEEEEEYGTISGDDAGSPKKPQDHTVFDEEAEESVHEAAAAEDRTVDRMPAEQVKDNRTVAPAAVADDVRTELKEIPNFDVKAQPRAEPKIELKTEPKAEPKAEIRKETEPVRKAETKAVPAALSDDDCDGYDFLPKRSVSERIAAKVDEVRSRPKAQTNAGAKQTVKKEEPKKASWLSEKLSTRQKTTVPAKSAEEQLDGPVQHEYAKRTSLLERVTREKATGRSVSEVIRETEQSPAAKEDIVSAAEDIEEYDADVSIHAEPYVMTDPVLTEEEKNEPAAEAAVLNEPETIVSGTIEENTETITEAAARPLNRNAAIAEEASEIEIEPAILEAVEAIFSGSDDADAEIEDVAAELVAEEETFIELTPETAEVSVPECAEADAEIEDVIAEIADISEETDAEIEDVVAEIAEISEETEMRTEDSIAAEDPVIEEFIDAAIIRWTSEAEDKAIETALAEDIAAMAAEVAAETHDIVVMPTAAFAVVPYEAAAEIKTVEMIADAPVENVSSIEEKVSEVTADEITVGEIAAEENIIATAADEITICRTLADAADEMAAHTGPTAWPIVETAAAELAAEMHEVIVPAAEPVELAAETYDMVKEIENDAPAQEVCDTDTEDAENDVLALLHGVIVDGGISPAADVTYEAPAVPSSSTEPYVNVVALPDKIPDEALGICFSFVSEENPLPSVDMRFVWGH
ncbi:MAG: hypothetical protein LBE48_02880 [Methanomassiliicoccaceae archaeon]|nr:hypothetical protein [Methanomassiliicoccaceae archaeon]